MKFHHPITLHCDGIGCKREIAATLHERILGERRGVHVVLSDTTWRGVKVTRGILLPPKGEERARVQPPGLYFYCPECLASHPNPELRTFDEPATV